MSLWRRYLSQFHQKPRAPIFCVFVDAEMIFSPLCVFSLRGVESIELTVALIHRCLVSRPVWRMEMCASERPPWASVQRNSPDGAAHPSDVVGESSSYSSTMKHYETTMLSQVLC